MSIPVISVTFEELAEDVSRRSARGIVALLLKDEEMAGKACEYRKGGIAEGWNENNKKHINAALKGAFKVLAVGVSEGGYVEALSDIAHRDWTWLAAPDATPEERSELADMIKAMRSEGKSKKAVFGNVEADSEGIVNAVTSEIVSTLYGDETVGANEYAARIAGVLAGLELEESVTGYEFTDIVSAEEYTDAAELVGGGKFVIVRDGNVYVAARGVTSLTGESAPAVFKKIKHVEGADMIAEDMKTIFKAGFYGEKANTYSNKQSLIAEYIAYFKGLEGSVLSSDYENTAMIDEDAQREYLESKGVDTYGMDEMQFLKANTDDKVFVKANVQLADAMEDIYITVALG